MDSSGKNQKARKVLTAVTFILLNVGIFLFVALREFGGEKPPREVQVRWSMLLCALALFLVCLASEVAKYALMMKHACGRVDWNAARRTFLIGRYYDNITPSSIGGQPFQIYYLSRFGFPAGTSAAVPLGSFLITQFSFVLISFFLFIFFGPLVDQPAVRITRWFGLVFYAFIPFVILMSTLFPQITQKAAAWLINLGCRLRLVKNREKTMARVAEYVDSYSTTLRGLLSDKKICSAMMGFGIISQLATCSIPYFVIRAFGGDMPYLACLVTTFSVYAAITFVPTPGNAGAAEGSFYLVFSSVAGSTFWAMLVWRFFSYYLYIILGLVVYAEMYFSKKAFHRGKPEENS